MTRVVWLWIPSGKTKNARLRLKIPEQLRPLILKRVEGMQPDEPILYPSSHKIHHHNYYVVQLARLCRLTEVPVVCPHSLRGMHATLALESGATGDAVAKALGHGSFEMTKTHYASASSVSNSESSRVAAALAIVSNCHNILEY
jgi:integrase